MMNMLDNKMVVGTTLFLIGVHQFNLIPFFGKDGFGSMKLFSLPAIGSVTPLGALGVVATVSGAYILYDCCFPQEYGF